MSTFKIDDFSGGRDRRPRIFYGKEKNRFKNLDNAYIGKDKKVHRRYPVRLPVSAITGVLGFVEIDGAPVFIASKIAAAAASISGVTTSVILFDEYPNHLATELIDAKVFDSVVVALIKHQYTAAWRTSTSPQYTTVLHVFDGLANKPTYVEDASFPVSWGPTLPQHLYRTGTLGAFVDYIPRLGIAASKVYVSGPDRNSYFSAPKNARVWNERTQAELLTGGEWFYWPNYDKYSGGLLDTRMTVDGVPIWVVSEDYTKLSENLSVPVTDPATLANWTCYVLEYCDSTGTWIKLIEDDATGAAPSVDGHYQVVPAPTRFPGGPNEIGFKIYATTPIGPIFRFRLIVGPPPIAVVSGNVWTNAQTRSAGQITFEGLPVFTPAKALSAIAGDNFTYFFVEVPDTAAIPRYVHTAGPDTLIDAFKHLTGYQRYYALILGWQYIFAAGPISALSFTAYTIASGVANGISISGYGWDPVNFSSFYLARKDMELALAGNGLAGVLPTANYSKQAGGFVTAYSIIKSYLGIHYRSITLLYFVNPNQLLEVLKDSHSLGTGPYVDGVAVQFYNQSILLTERGLRAFSVGGFQSDRADDTNIGEPNEVFATTDRLIAAAFWPYTGQYIACLEIAGAIKYYVFDYSRDSKISCWSVWSLGMTPLDRHGLMPIGPRLYIFDGFRVGYIDAEVQPGQFFDDVAYPTSVVQPFAYKSVADCYQNDFNSPGFNHKVTKMDLISTGLTEVEFRLLSEGVERTIPGTTINGTTRGARRVRLAMRANAVAPIFSSLDVNEWILDSYSLDFETMKR